VAPNFDYTGDFCPWYVTPSRTVLKHIERPEYAENPAGYPILETQSKGDGKIPIYTPDEIKGIRAACKLSRKILDIAAEMVKPGVTTEEIDRVVHDATIAHDAYPSPLNYHQFPKSCCTSVNEVICHGIPDLRPLKDGDIVNIDISVYYKGFHGDVNETYPVGTVKEDSLKLIQVTYECLDLAINETKSGTLIRDFGKIISKHAGKSGLSVVRSYCGHGIGRFFHCSPNVPHYARSKAIGACKPGMIFTIEPMINMGVWQDVTWADEWTSATKDGQRSAQFEHTILVTDSGYEILTK